jgi:hypothetical protein
MFYSTTSSQPHPITMSIDETSSASAYITSNQFFTQTPPAPPIRPQRQLHSKATQTDYDDTTRQTSVDQNTFDALIEGVHNMSPTERCMILV